MMRRYNIVKRLFFKWFLPGIWLIIVTFGTYFFFFGRGG